ncbi:MAG TPA: IMP cyclohydrolase [candidate division WOR-3 bacterium]|uniref:IMP cyclohydrolase n=1 Tax=candidate division WOR-3 bacterium TaxID=2052148 RepID=A0A7V0T7A8_UNCW3|nr:IMP cyclohydrolase [candidate division WOR-3 bacterium]
MRYALLSVWDKQGLEEIGQVLVETGHELLSTSRSAEVLRAAGLPVTEVSDWTGAPEMLGGRVKTIHPRIAAAILNTRTDPDADRIDVVVCNLYPFADGIARGATEAELIELIDIGGVTLLRAAAKNYHYVLPVPGPDWYPPVMDSLRTDRAAQTDLRLTLARATFKLTSGYDSLIAQSLPIAPAPRA